MLGRLSPFIVVDSCPGASPEIAMVVTESKSRKAIAQPWFLREERIRDSGVVFLLLMLILGV